MMAGNRSVAIGSTRQRSGRTRLSRSKPATTVDLRKILRPLFGDSHRRTSVAIHQYLRNLILSNTLPPETALSQVEVARCLKVSRTPVREALRMLQEEGLISAEPNYRCRVLGFDPEELELLYVSRIMNEGISAAITVEKMTDADVEKLRAIFADMNKAEERGRFGDWVNSHRAFHQMLFVGANLKLQRRMYVDCHRSERYVYNALQSGLFEVFERTAIEHEQLVRACELRQSAVVASLLTRHLSYACVEILKALAPHWEPVTLRAANAIMLRGVAHLDDRRKGRGRTKQREGLFVE